MSVFTKLIRTPGLFFADYKKKRAMRGDIGPLLARLRTRKPEVADTLSSSLPRSAVFEALAQESFRPIFLDYNGQTVYCCLKQDYLNLLVGAFQLAEHLRCELVVTVNDKTYAATEKHLATIACAMIRNSRWLLRFCSEPEQLDIAVRVWDVLERDEREMVVSLANNPFAKQIPTELFFDGQAAIDDAVHLANFFACPLDTQCLFDVDIVYTWVNHDDPDWRTLIRRFKTEDEINWDRFHSSDELRYSLLSVRQFAPWVRRIFIVTNCNPPSWLPDDPRIQFVAHEDIFPDAEDCLPTFNSHAIEACIMNIDGLSEHFIYFNDDVFLARPAYKSDFFTGNGNSISFLEPYGMVVGDTSGSNPDYLNAAITGRKLIEQRFQRSPTQLHRHTPFALKKSVLLQMQEDFAEMFAKTRRARFRLQDNISPLSFLYHHYAYQQNQSVHGDCQSLLIKYSNYRRLLPALRTNGYLQFFCINDGGQSTADELFIEEKKRTLDRLFESVACE